MGLIVSWLPFWPSSPSLSAPAAFAILPLLVLCSGRVFWMLYASSDQPFCHFRPRDELQRVEIHSSPIRWLHVISHIPSHTQHLSSSVLLSFLRSTSCTHILPSWQSLVQPLECCIAIKYSVPKPCGIHNGLQRSSALPKSMGSALLLTLHLSSFLVSWCLGPLAPWWLPPDMAEPGHASATGAFFFQQLCPASITSWNEETGSFKPR